MSIETKLVSWEVRNFMRIELFQADVNGGHIVISADNDGGKTSVVRSFFAALQGVGKRGEDVQSPVHLGSDEMYVKLDLGTHTVERYGSEDNIKLVVRAAGGSKVKDGQELCNSFRGRCTRDPLRFTRQKDADMVGELLDILGVEPPVDDVRDIIGDATKLVEPDPDEQADQYLQRLVGDPAGVYYLIRRDRRSKLDDKQAALEDQRKLLEEIGGPIHDNEEPQRPSEVITEIERLTVIANQRTDAFASAQAKRRASGEALLRLDHKRDDLQAGLTGIETLEKRVADLRRELAEKEAKIASEQTRFLEMSKTVDRDEAELESLTSAAEAAKAVADKMPDPSDQIEAKKESLRSIERTNRKLSERINCQSQVIRLETETASAMQSYQEFDQIVTKIRDLRSHLIDDIDLGFPGLAIGDGVLLLNGVPVKQSGTATQIRLGAKVAMMEDPAPLLKILMVDAGEQLGIKNRELLFSLATEAGWQVIFTRVADQAKLSFEIVDGKP